MFSLFYIEVFIYLFIICFLFELLLFVYFCLSNYFFSFKSFFLVFRFFFFTFPFIIISYLFHFFYIQLWLFLTFTNVFCCNSIFSFFFFFLVISLLRDIPIFARFRLVFLAGEFYFLFKILSYAFFFSFWFLTLFSSFFCLNKIYIFIHFICISTDMTNNQLYTFLRIFFFIIRTAFPSWIWR